MDTLAENKTKLTNLACLFDLSEGNMDFVSELISMFIKDMPESIILMQVHAERKEWDKLKAVAHKMKPSLSFIGLISLQKDIQKIELSAGERAGLDKIQALIGRCHLVVDQAVEELRNELLQLSR